MADVDGSRAPDAAQLAVALGRALRTAGISTGPERALRFARALELAPPADRDALYWTARAVFVSSRDQVEAFDRVFAGLAGEPQRRPASPDEEGRGPKAEGGDDRVPPSGAAAGASLVAAARAGPADGEGEESEGLMAAASAEERLAQKSFDELDAYELGELRRMMARLALAPPLRRTRRRRRGRHGEHLDVRSTIRRSHRTGGDPVRWARSARRTKRRRLVMLLDISGSMEPYARAFLQFLESGVGGASAEAFVFATRLTRLTPALRGRNPQAAIEHAAALARDWSGGTRIGAALKEFNDRYGRRGLARGAVVVILSDGWESTDPEAVAREMDRLGRLAHSIVWVNPRAASPQFAPLAGGMAAALPHVDALLSGDRFESLHAVADAIAGAG